MPTALRAPASGWPLRLAASKLAMSLPAAAEPALVDWLDRLAEWNTRVDLTAARSAGELVDLMTADALVLASRLAPGARVVDIGTGAGAPGLAVALLRPDLTVTLVEPLGKRAAFLRTVIGSLDRVDVKVEACTGDTLAERSPASWDVALSRATLPPAAWLDLASHLLVPGGSAWVFLAREGPPAHAAMTRDETVDYVWPLTNAHRSLVRYARP